MLSAAFIRTMISLMMEADSKSETAVDFYGVKLLMIPADRLLRFHYCWIKWIRPFRETWPTLFKILKCVVNCGSHKGRCLILGCYFISTQRERPSNHYVVQTTCFFLCHEFLLSYHFVSDFSYFFLPVVFCLNANTEMHVLLVTCHDRYFVYLTLFR